MTTSDGQTRISLLEATILLSAGVQVAIASAIFALLAELQDEMGFSDTFLGALAAISFVSAVLSLVGLAKYSDRGHSSIMLIGGPALAAVGCVAFAFTDDPAVLLSARFLLGLAVGITAPAARRFVSVVHADTPGRALGRLNGAQGLGLLIGAPLGTVLVEQMSIAAPFVLFGGLSAAASTVLLVNRRRIARDATVLEPATPAAVDAEATQTPSRSTTALLRRPDLRPALALSIGLWTATGTFEVSWSRMLTDHGFSNAFVGLSVLFFGVPLALASPVAGRILDRRPAIPVGVKALGTIGLLLPLYAFVVRAVVILGGAIVEGIAEAFLITAIHTTAARRAQPGEIGAVHGLLEAAGMSAAAVASVAAGLLIALGGTPTAIFVAFIVLVTLAITASTLERRAPGSSNGTPASASFRG
ncbi:MAG: MFS transporter [Acidimicrobiia bacterium]|nr:MFS transporter [Acidimicrobiia bacterium]